MVIGIDADGVLTDMAGFNFKYGEKFFGHGPVDPTGYKTRDIFGESKAREFFFGLRYFYEYCCRLAPRENAAEVCRSFDSAGHELYVITARKFSAMKSPLGSLSRKMFRSWILKNQLPIRDIMFCPEVNTPMQKLEYCRSISADIMIEDNSETAFYLAENGMKVLLFDAPYNRGTVHENITRVKSWGEISECIFMNADMQ